jgi:Xaa-Pro aminopeptidase
LTGAAVAHHEAVQAAPAPAGAAAGHVQAAAEPLYPSERLERAADAAARAGLAALLLTPGPDLRYVSGYDAHDTERLTCLAVPARARGAAGTNSPFLVVPRLEMPAAQASPAAALGLDIVAWDETDDPYALVASRIGTWVRGRTVGLSDRMRALMVLALRDALPGTGLALASAALRGLRQVKSEAEVAALRAAGEAIDRVHRKVPGWLRPGRTEAQVAADIADAIVAEGHARADFAIVASGPNAASPHHAASGRVLQAGDVVVVDIGGTMPSGYCSDCTRTYAIGEPPAEFRAYYEVLMGAQRAACEAVRPGAAAEDIDAAAREPIARAGYGDYFVHRTGHGIGLETHEDPYIVTGNETPLRPGMAFSIEPGIYAGPHGARIEDIVVCGHEGAIRLNTLDRSLVVVEP